MWLMLWDAVCGYCFDDSVSRCCEDDVWGLLQQDAVSSLLNCYWADAECGYVVVKMLYMVYRGGMLRVVYPCGYNAHCEYV